MPHRDRKGKKRGTKSPGEKSKKIKFHGNRHTSEKSSESVSTSAKKLENQDEFEPAVDENSSYVLLCFSLVFAALQSVLTCKVCMGEIKFLKKSQVGLGFTLCVKCDCDTMFTVDSCPKVRNAFEVNRRLTFVMRLLGVGLSGINLFCSLMDLGTGLSKNGYYSILNNIYIAVKAIAKIVFTKAAKEENEENVKRGGKKDEVTVSGDGSWAKRGFTSLLGIVSLIGKFSNKVIDVIVKCKVCKACEKWVGKEDTDEYLEWYEDHQEECTANHEGSSGKMEVDGVIEMFKRSLEWFGIKYKKYIGDGDSKTFKNLLEADIYNGDPLVEKSECVLHVKKRMYRRVKDAKKARTQLEKAKKAKEKKKNAEEDKKIKAQKEKTSEKEEVKGKRKRRSKKDMEIAEASKVKYLSLTNKLMIKLSAYYGLAIIRNENSLENMKKAVWATYNHYTSTNENPQHDDCSESWCEYKKLKAQNLEHTFDHPPAFDESTANILKPIYEELSLDDLLQRCLGKNTQNNNEAFNHCVWNLAPKHVFVGPKTLEIAALTAACTFNEGFLLILKIMETMGITIGPHAITYARRCNSLRLAKAKKDTANASKEARSSRRSEKIAENDAYEETEGLLYAPGID